MILCSVKLFTIWRNSFLNASSFQLTEWFFVLHFDNVQISSIWNTSKYCNLANASVSNWLQFVGAGLATNWHTGCILCALNAKFLDLNIKNSMWQPCWVEAVEQFLKWRFRGRMSAGSNITLDWLCDVSVISRAWNALYAQFLRDWNGESHRHPLWLRIATYFANTTDSKVLHEANAG